MYGISLLEGPVKENLFNNNIKPVTRYTAELQIRACNICNASFVQNSRFDRFCTSCKNSDELFKFADWGSN